MKRALILFLAVTLMFTSTGAFAATESDVIQGEVLEAYTREAEILINLDVLTSCNLESYDPYSYISNYEFLDMLSAFTGEGEVSDYVAYASSLGVLNSEEKLQKYLYPTYDFALTSTLGVLGYNKIKALAGEGNAMWYMTLGNRLGLLDGLDYSEEKSLRRGEAVKLVFNMLEAQVLQLSSIEMTEDGETKSNFVQTDQMAMYHYKGIYKKYGILTSTEFTAMYDDSTTGKNGVTVDGISYSIEDGADFDKYTGMYCDLYVKKTSGVEHIVSATPSPIVKSIEIEADMFDGYDASTRELTFIKGNNEQTIHLDRSVAVIKNGRGLKTFTEEDFKISLGTITVYDNEGDGVYDLAVVNSAAVFIVDKVNVANRTIYNKITYDAQNNKIELDEREADNKIRILRDGIDIGISDISEGELLEVYYNPNAKKKIIKIVVGSKSVSGIAGVILDDEVEIQGQRYEIAKGYNKANAANERYAPDITAGNYYKFYITSDGRIAAADSDTLSDMQVGYIYDMTDIDKVFSHTYKLKIFTADGEWKIYTLADRVILNGEPDDSDNVYSQISGLTEQLILYKRDKNEMITELRCAVNLSTAGDDDFNTLGYTDRYYRDGTVPMFDSEYYIAPTAVIFAVPTSNREEEFSIISKNSLESYLTYSTALYDIDDYNLCNYIVMKRNDTVQSTLLNKGAVMLVSESVTTMTADGKPVKQISGNSGYFTKYAITFSEFAQERKIVNGSTVFTSELSDIKKGDFVRFLTDVTGNIQYYEVLGSAGDKTEYYPSNMVDYSTYLRGYVQKSDASKYAILLNVNGNVKPVVGSSVTQVYIVKGDAKGCSISKGTMNDIAPQDFVLTVYPIGAISTVVIYRN